MLVASEFQCKGASIVVFGLFASCYSTQVSLPFVSPVCLWLASSRYTVVLRRLPCVEYAAAAVQDLRQHLLRRHSWTCLCPYYVCHRPRSNRRGTAGIGAADCRKHPLARLSRRRHQVNRQLARPL